MGDNMKYTKFLKKGDTIGLIAPAGPLRNIRIEDIEFILTVKEKYSEIFKEEVLDV